MSEYVLRNEALRYFSMLEQTRCRTLTIEAQAGQGKSTAIAQFLEQATVPVLVHACSPLDNDPTHLMRAIAQGLSDMQGLESSPDLSQMDTHVPPLVLAGSMCDRIGSFLCSLGQPFILVMDDLHLLDGARESLSLLLSLLEEAPSLKMATVSRFPIMLDGAPLFRDLSPLRIDNAVLAFDRSEIARLFLQLEHRVLDREVIEKLYQVTDGWVTGLQLLRKDMAPDTGSPAIIPGVEGAAYFLNFLNAEGLYHEELVLAAHLDNLPQALLSELAPRALEILAALEKRKQFVRLNGRDAPVYHLHHLLRDALLTSELRTYDRKQWLARAGEWLVEKGSPEEGLNVLVMGENWNTLSRLLLQHAPDMLTCGMHSTLARTILSLPDSIRREDGWLTLHMGSALLVTDPPRAASYLEEALETFVKIGDEHGELLACCNIAFFHTIVSGNLAVGKKAAKRSVVLYKELFPLLDQRSKIISSLLVLCSFTYYFMEKELENRIMSWLEKNDIDLEQYVNSRTVLLVFLVYAMRGNHNAAITSMNNHFLVKKKILSERGAAFFFEFMLMNFYSVSGHENAHRFLIDIINTNFYKTEEEMYLSSFVAIWELDLFMRNGQPEKILEVPLERRTKNLHDSDHIVSLLLYYYHTSLALVGEQEEALALVKKALKLRARSGGVAFRYLSRLFAGLTYLVSGNYKTAKRLFNCVLRWARTGSGDHRSACHAYLALLHFRTGEPEEAREHLHQLFTSMNRHGTSSFYTWQKDHMLEVLSLAVKHSICPDQARELALRRHSMLLEEDGHPLPRLLLDDLGDTGVHFLPENRLLAFADIKKTARMLLKDLIHRPGMRVDVEILMDEYWPDKPLSKADSNLRRHVDELRRVFGETFAPGQGGKYFSIGRKVLSLEHCQTVSQALLESLHRAERAYGAKQPLLAFIHMSDALALYRTVNATPELLANNPVYPELSRLSISMIPLWTDYFLTFHHFDEGHAILDKAMEIFPLRPEFIRAKYDLYTAAKAPQDAANLLSSFEAELGRTDLDNDHREELLRQIWG